MKSLTQSLTQSLTAIGVLTIVLTLALAANFAYGQWSNPPSSPPGGNVAAPINVGPDNQVKIGKLSVNQLTASTQVRGSEMWAIRYCDSLGNNCFTPDQVRRGCSSPRAEHMEIKSSSRPSGFRCTTTTQKQCVDGSYKTLSSNRRCYTPPPSTGGRGGGQSGTGGGSPGGGL